MRYILPRPALGSAPKHTYEKGQALIILLLVMSVVLVVALSIVSRSVTDIQTTTFDEESSRAFSAAEAGVEDLLNKIGTQPVPTTAVTNPNLGNNSSFTATPRYITNSTQFIYPKPLRSGESATFLFVERRSEDGTFACTGSCFNGGSINRLYWGSPINAVGTVPAVELSIYYDRTGAASGVASPNNFSNVVVARSTFDPSSRGNNFGSAVNCPASGCQVGNVAFRFRTNAITFNSLGIPAGCRAGCILFATVKLLYNTQGDEVALEVPGGSTLPAQGILVESEGLSQDTRRKLNVFKTFPMPPAIFEASIYSGGNIEK